MRGPPSCSMDSPDLIVHTGWGVKEGQGLLRKFTWRRRFFVLRKRLASDDLSADDNTTHLLVYYRSDEQARDEVEPLGAIRINSTCKASRTYRNNKNCVQIRCKAGERTYYLIPEDDIDEWIYALTALSPKPSETTEEGNLRRGTLGSKPKGIRSTVIDSSDDVDDSNHRTHNSESETNHQNNEPEEVTFSDAEISAIVDKAELNLFAEERYAGGIRILKQVPPKLALEVVRAGSDFRNGLSELRGLLNSELSDESNWRDCLFFEEKRSDYPSLLLFRRMQESSATKLISAVGTVIAWKLSDDGILENVKGLVSNHVPTSPVLQSCPEELRNGAIDGTAIPEVIKDVVNRAVAAMDGGNEEAYVHDPDIDTDDATYGWGTILRKCSSAPEQVQIDGIIYLFAACVVICKELEIMMNLAFKNVVGTRVDAPMMQRFRQAKDLCADSTDGWMHLTSVLKIQVRCDSSSAIVAAISSLEASGFITKHRENLLQDPTHDIRVVVAYSHAGLPTQILVEINLELNPPDTADLMHLSEAAFKVSQASSGTLKELRMQKIIEYPHSMLAIIQTASDPTSTILVDDFGNGNVF